MRGATVSPARLERAHLGPPVSSLPVVESLEQLSQVVRGEGTSSAVAAGQGHPTRYGLVSLELLEALHRQAAQREGASE